MVSEAGIKKPYHTQMNCSSTEIFVGLEPGLKEVQKEVLLLTLPDLIGSVGGGLGVFFGFSISAVLLYLIDKILGKCVYTKDSFLEK